MTTKDELWQIEGDYIDQTELAVLLGFPGRATIQEWFPKSQIFGIFKKSEDGKSWNASHTSDLEEGDKALIEIPEWLAVEKGFDLEADEADRP